MDSRIAVLVAWVIFGGLLAQYLYTPFPENAKHPVKQRFSRAMVRVMHDIVSPDFLRRVFNVISCN